MASFVDRANVTFKAGNGGDGGVSFHREKFVVNGGPDGGDGGRGGDIVLVADSNLHTLLDFSYKAHYRAENGAPGSSNNRTGKSGQDMLIPVPVGTVIIDKQTNKIVADMSEKGKRKVLLQGGRGGFGNARFATPTRQAPNFAKPGIKTQEREFILELKTIADVGLVGFPNVGKSSILSVVTRARPKVASYHFTTLSPNLGICSYAGVSFVMADIPGLIENASEGAGLGFNFLRHIERTRLIIHVVDVSGVEGRDPVEDYRLINKELEKYGGLDKRAMIIAANKMDLPSAQENLPRLIEEANGVPVFPVSAATNQGFDALLGKTVELLSKLEPIKEFAEEIVLDDEPLRGFEVERIAENVYRVSGPSAESLIASVNFSDYESMQWFQKTLRTSGIIDALKEAGCQEGDSVQMGSVSFDFIE
ncbi:MAG: GTPase ObgE [Eubacteriales bacterium]|nr:GTPase ObgE [Eubacteriales bacterium]